jgi:hypothetical protein
MKIIIPSLELKNISFIRNESKFQKKLKNICISITLILIFFSTSSTLAQTVFNPETSGISKTELNTILQTCIDLPELQKYYSVAADGSKEQLNIVQYPVSFDDINLIKHSKSVNFIQNSDIDKLTNSNYFMFRRILPNQNQFKIIFNYFYNKDSEGKRNITIILDLSKSDSVWSIINSSLSGDTL